MKKLKNINILRFNNDILLFYLIEYSLDKLNIIDTIPLSLHNNDSILFNKILKHSKKVIIIVEDTFSFHHSFPVSVNNNIHNIILNMNSDIIIPSSKREIKFIKLNEIKNFSNYYISIFDKNTINKIRLLLFENKFKIISILDNNIAFYSFLNNYLNYSLPDNSIHYFKYKNIFYYLLNINNTMNLESIKIPDSTENNFKSYVILKHKINPDEIEFNQIDNDNVLLYGSILGGFNKKYNSFFNFNRLKNIKFSKNFFDKLLTYIIPALILNFIFLFINFTMLKNKNYEISAYTENIFLENYPNISRIVKINAQAHNENLNLKNNLEFITDNILNDKKLIFKFRNIIRNIINNKPYIHITNIVYSDKSLDFTGKCDNIRILNNTVHEINKLNFIQDVKILRTQRENLLKDEGIDFTLNIIFN